MIPGKPSVLTAPLTSQPGVLLGGVFRDPWLILALSLALLLFFSPLFRRRKGLLFIYLTTLLFFFAVFAWQGLNQRMLAQIFMWGLVLAGLCLMLFTRLKPVEGPNPRVALVRGKLLLVIIVPCLLLRAYAAFGSAVYEGPMYMALGSRMMAAGGSPYGDAFIYPYLGAVYGPLLFLAELVFVPFARFAEPLLHSEALIPWAQVPDWFGCVAQIHLSYVFFDALIMAGVARLAGRYWKEAALAWLLHPFTGLTMAAGLTNLVQTGLLVWAFALWRDDVACGVLTALAILCKGHPLLLVPFWALFKEGRHRSGFLVSCASILVPGGIAWLALAWLSRPPGTLSPIGFQLYASGHDYQASIYHLLYPYLGGAATNTVRLIPVALLCAWAFRIARSGRSRENLCRATLLLVAAPILFTPYLHPGFLYPFIVFLLAFGLLLTLGADREGPGPSIASRDAGEVEK